MNVIRVDQLDDDSFIKYYLEFLKDFERRENFTEFKEKYKQCLLDETEKLFDDLKKQNPEKLIQNVFKIRGLL